MSLTPDITTPPGKTHYITSRQGIHYRQTGVTNTGLIDTSDLRSKLKALVTGDGELEDEENEEEQLVDNTGLSDSESDSDDEEQ